METNKGVSEVQKYVTELYPLATAGFAVDVVACAAHGGRAHGGDEGGDGGDEGGDGGDGGGMEGEEGEEGEEETFGSLAALRSVRERIVGDFVVLSGDVMTDANLNLCFDLHRQRLAGVTALFKRLPVDPAARKQVKASSTVGIGEDQRMVFYGAASDKKGVTVSKMMLRRAGKMTLSSDLEDVHCYIFAPWVLDVIDERPKMESIQGDLVPYLVRRQFSRETSANHLPKSAYASPLAAADALNVAAAGELVHGGCFAFVTDARLCTRANSVEAYMAINRAVIRLKPLVEPWDKSEATDRAFYKDLSESTLAQIGTDCLVGVGFQAGENNSVKKSTIGSHCRLGTGVKITNSVLMDHVIVEDGARISNSIVCSNAEIGAKSQLDSCQIGARVKVDAGRVVKENSIA